MGHSRTQTHRADLEEEVFEDGEIWVEGEGAP
jgi:hypothetical protein